MQIFLLHFNQYRFVFLYYKDTNPVLKYPVFVKTLKKIKKYFVFMHTTKSLKKKHIVFEYNKENIVFEYNKENFKNMFLALITSLLKSRELGQHFKNSKKNILFSFNI